MAIKKTNNDTFRDVKDFIKMFGSLTPVGQYNLLAYTMNNFREQMSPDLYNVFSSLADDRFDIGADESTLFNVGESNLGINEGYGISASEKKSIGREGFLLLQKATEKRRLEHEIYVTNREYIDKYFLVGKVIGNFPQICPVEVNNLGNNPSLEWNARDLKFLNSFDFNVPSISDFCGLKLAYDYSFSRILGYEPKKRNSDYSIYVSFKKPQEKHKNALNLPLSCLSLDEIKTIKGALYEKLNLNKTKKKHTGVMI